MTGSIWVKGAPDTSDIPITGHRIYLIDMGDTDEGKPQLSIVWANRNSLMWSNAKQHMRVEDLRDYLAVSAEGLLALTDEEKETTVRMLRTTLLNRDTDRTVRDVIAKIEKSMPAPTLDKHDVQQALHTTLCDALTANGVDLSRMDTKRLDALSDELINIVKDEGDTL